MLSPASLNLFAVVLYASDAPYLVFSHPSARPYLALSIVDFSHPVAFLTLSAASSAPFLKLSTASLALPLESVPVTY